MGVYVHFPWCLSKCGYCDFFSVATGPSTVIEHEKYADQVLAEFERRMQSLPPHQLTTLFLGGGTPSLWEPKALARVIAGVTRGFASRASEVEITVECNPSSLDERKAHALLEAGVSRISLGIQSLDDEQLVFLGRRHDKLGALKALDAALGAGFASVSADLLFGLPRQTTLAEVEQILRVASTGVSHLSAYALTIEEGTHFGQLKKAGRLPLALDERVAEAFEAVHEALGAAGFEHYEISNFARPGKRSLHNQQYWWGLPYLGLGCAAWGTVKPAKDVIRYRNVASVEGYLSQDFQDPKWVPFEPTEGGPREPRELVTDAMRLEERLLLGLRLLEGVDLAALEAELGIAVLTKERLLAIDRQVARGNLLRRGSRIAIPPEAWLRADSTIVDLA